MDLLKKIKGAEGIKKDSEEAKRNYFFAKIKSSNEEQIIVDPDYEPHSSTTEEMQDWRLIDLSKPIESDCELKFV